MSFLNILTTETHEKELRQKSRDFDMEKIEAREAQKFFDDLQETMHKADGVGLAAPQAGEFSRVVCVNMGDGAQVFINPEILKKSWGKIVMEEGCLSVPGIYGKVRRPKKIVLKYFDKQGKLKKQKYDKMPARILQHEIDHLDGVLFIDKMIK